MFKVVAKYIAPSGMPSPLLWGHEATVRERFGNHVSPLQVSLRYYVFDYPFPPSEVVDFFRSYYGPTNRAFAELDRAGQVKLHAELEKLWAEHNQAGDGFTRVEAEYLEVIGTRTTTSTANGKVQ